MWEVLWGRELGWSGDLEDWVDVEVVAILKMVGCAVLDFVIILILY